MSKQQKQQGYTTCRVNNTMQQSSLASSPQIIGFFLGTALLKNLLNTFRTKAIGKIKNRKARLNNSCLLSVC